MSWLPAEPRSRPRMKISSPAPTLISTRPTCSRTPTAAWLWSIPGGWYKLCCPSSQLQKPDVLGGVYRVRRKDAVKVDDPRGLKLPWKTLTALELSNLLDDARPAVRHRAVEALGRGGDVAAFSLTSHSLMPNRSPEARRNAVWAATRINHPAARLVILGALSDPDETVRQVAIHSTSLRRDKDAVSLLTQLLHGPSLQNRRAAAEALGRIGDKSAVPELLKALGELSAPDRILEHSLTYALIEIDDPKGTSAGLASDQPRVRRAALAALDQMDQGGLDSQQVAGYLSSSDASLKETASWIIGRHPEWAGALAGFFGNRLKSGKLSVAEQTELERQLARFASAPQIQSLLAERLSDANATASAKLVSLRAMAQSGLKDVPASWTQGVANVLGGDNRELESQAVATARSLPFSKDQGRSLTPRLLAIAKRAQTPADVRLGALAAVPGGLSHVGPEIFTFLLAQLDPQQPAAARSSAVDVVSRAKLAPAQLETLADKLKTAGPLDVDRLLTAFEQATDESLGLKLVKALGESSALSSLRVDAIKQHLAKYSPPVQTAAQALYAKLNVDAAKQKAKIDELMTKVSSGDVRRGQLAFHSEKAACFTCHAIGYRGGDVGPDLTKVGQIRSERDLLEAILYPSASFIRSYEPVVVATADGKVQNGLLKNETSEEILLVTGANQQVRVNRSDIEEIRPSTVSVMPAGLDQQLTVQELADLVAFLKACR